jgi:hypothetical protein
MRTFAMRTLAMRTLAVRTFALRTLAMRTFALRTFAMRTLAMRTFAIRTLAMRTLAQSKTISACHHFTAEFSPPLDQAAHLICRNGTVKVALAVQLIAALGGRFISLAQRGAY